MQSRRLMTAVIVALVALIPAMTLESMGLCAVKQFLNVDCPGCGLLRSWAYLIRFEWAEAFASYPLGALIYCGLCFYIIDQALSHLIKRPLLGQRLWRSSLITVGLCGVFVQWIAKLVGIW